MTLTEASKLAKKWALFIVVGVVFYYIALFILVPGVKLIVNAVIPEKDPPNASYGVLPALEFTVKKAKGGFDPKYILDTKDGKLPTDMPKKAKVYPVRIAAPSFEKGKNAIRTAQELGYTEDDLTTSLKDPIFKWKKISSDGVLEIDTNNENITLYTPLAGKTEIFPKGSLTPDKAKQYARTMLSKINLFEDALYKEGEQRVTLGQFSGGALRKTNSTIDAQIARVDFFRSIGNYPILGADPNVGMIFMFLRKPSSKDIHYNFPVVKSHVTEIGQKTEATYALINVSDAWDFIKENKGAVVSILPENASTLLPYTPVSVEEVFINNIYLAYYENGADQKYLQPVYVFNGKYTTAGTQGGSINFYYPAVTPEYIKAAE